MPLYQYACRCGRTIEMARAVGQRDIPPACPCGRVMARDFSAAPQRRTRATVLDREQSFEERTAAGEFKLYEEYRRDGLLD